MSLLRAMDSVSFVVIMLPILLHLLAPYSRNFNKERKEII